MGEVELERYLLKDADEMIPSLVKPVKGLQTDPEQFRKACKFLSEVFKFEESVVIRLAVKKLSKRQKFDTSWQLHTIRKRLTLGSPKPFRDAPHFATGVRKMIHHYSTAYSQPTPSLQPTLLNMQSMYFQLEMETVEKFITKIEALFEDYYPEFKDMLKQAL